MKTPQFDPRPISRRNYLKMSGAASLGLGLSACVPPLAQTPAPAQTAAGATATPVPPGRPPAAIAMGNGVQYELIGRYDVDRLNKIMTTELKDFKDYPIKYTPAQNAVRLYRVTYPCVIPERNNKPTMATGLVAIPETGAPAMPMVSYQHGTVYLKNQVPSFPEESYETRLMVAQFAGQGYLVIGADYFGMGLSPENEGYVVLGSLQQACSDMHRAALQVLGNEHIAVTDFFVTGWSEGGITNMAFLEKLERDGVTVRAASTASAPCDALSLLSHFLYFPRKIDGSWVSICFILSAFSFEEYYGARGLAQAFFTPDAYDLCRKIYLKEDPNVEQDLPADLHKIVRPEYFTPRFLEGTEYGRLLRDTTAYRWIIQTPVRNYYGEIDEVVSVELAKLPMLYQQSLGNTKVEAMSAGAIADHRGTFLTSVAEQKKWFDSLLTS
jgi:pimeloyl-ACP methyl ester carboxylesterase